MLHGLNLWFLNSFSSSIFGTPDTLKLTTHTIFNKPNRRTSLFLVKMRRCASASDITNEARRGRKKCCEPERKKIKETQVQRNETISSLDKTELKCAQLTTAKSNNGKCTVQANACSFLFHFHLRRSTIL